jgi:hypothetical protein
MTTTDLHISQAVALKYPYDLDPPTVVVLKYFGNFLVKINSLLNSTKNIFSRTRLKKIIRVFTQKNIFEYSTKTAFSVKRNNLFVKKHLSNSLVLKF